MTGRTAIAGAIIALSIGFAAPAAGQSANGASNGVGTPFELTFWQSVAGSDDPALYEAYLQQYPAGTFSALARVKVTNLRKTVVETPVPAAGPVVAAVVTAVAPAAVSAAPPAPDASDAALLAELAKSQDVDAGIAQVAATQGFALPRRPLLNDVVDLPLPAAFCSAEQRNAFHEARYKPVLEQARANNAAAVAHMKALQDLYDSHQLARDPAPMNALAAEARDYQQQVAAVTYSRQAALVRQFDAIMAVPVTACQVVASK
ncbi:hypothetical protein OVA07_15450 [Novosphingobium sp. SL115]|uniref:hypothetical protein n=1 Tax=Novosphingobium sp. SL115 TaxID=2995150 RepID=UPI002275A144|nr:hypothetical protein [Novosphingobium sp. SL115]MCY1672402.1 hypothetical protein [Novosphingobium sp. SL115]